MHYGSITQRHKPGPHGGAKRPLTAAARVYRILRNWSPRWVGSWKLTLAAETSAVSTRVSEVRHQLPEGWKIEHKQVKQKHYYRIVKLGIPEQRRHIAELKARPSTITIPTGARTS